MFSQLDLTIVGRLCITSLALLVQLSEVRPDFSSLSPISTVSKQSGAIWGSQLPEALLAAVGGNQALATSIYRNPIGWIGLNGFDNPQRGAVADAYSDGQRIILIAAASVSGLSIILACCFENIKRRFRMPYFAEKVT